MDAGHRQQGRDGSVLRSHPAIRQDDEIVTGSDGGADLAEQPLQRSFQPHGPVPGREEDRQGDGLETARPAAVQPAELVQLLVLQDGRIQLDLPGGHGGRLQQIALRADGGLHRHDDLFADAIDRRVGHLGEQLLEVVVQQLRPIREDRQGRVIAHRADGLVGFLGHRRQQDLQVLGGVAEHLLAQQHRFVVRFVEPRPHGQVVQGNEVVAHPVRVGQGLGHLLFQLLVGDDPALLQIDQEHPARLQPALVQHPLRRNVEDADFGRHDHQVVLGDVVARRPQAVAVQHGADADAIGEGDRRRSVPRLHQAGVILVEGPLGRAHGPVAAPRLRDHHHDRVRQRPAGQHQQFQGIVELGRIAAALVDDRQQLLDVRPEQLGAEHPLPGVHPVDVAAQRVDLAVVAQVAVGMGPGPGREGVGAEARMDQRQGRVHRRIFQVGEVMLQLRGVEHALVNQCLAGQARQVEHPALFQARLPSSLLHALADDVQPALERQFIAWKTALPTNENLPHRRLAPFGSGADVGVIGRHVPPAQDGLSLLADDLLEGLLHSPALHRVGGQEDQTRTIGSGTGKANPQLIAFPLQEAMGHLQENAGPVSGVLLAAARAAMLQVYQDLDRFADNVVRPAGFQIDDKADAAGIVFVLRVIQTLPGRNRLRHGTVLFLRVWFWSRFALSSGCWFVSLVAPFRDPAAAWPFSAERSSSMKARAALPGGCRR